MASSDEEPASAAVTKEPVCKSTGPVTFAAQPPQKRSLSFCRDYASNTCCDKSHTDVVSRSVFPYFEDLDKFTEECRVLSVSVLCSPCHPEVGVGAKSGICESMCNRWYSACADGMYSVSSQSLTPCSSGSLLCFKLRDAVANGREMCEWSGFEVGVNPADLVQATPFGAYLSSDDEAFNDPDKCFGGAVALSPPKQQRPADPERTKAEKKAQKARRRAAAAERKRIEWLQKMALLSTSSAILLSVVWYFRDLLLPLLVLPYAHLRRALCPRKTLSVREARAKKFYAEQLAAQNKFKQQNSVTPTSS